MELISTLMRKKIACKSYVYDELAQPHANLESFFECGWLSNHLVILKYWYKIVSTKTCYTQKDCPADLVYTHKMCCNLINAAWLMKQMNMQSAFD